MKYHNEMDKEQLIEWRRDMIRKARRLLGMTATEIATQIGTSYPNMANIVQRGSRESEFAARLDTFLVTRVEDRLQIEPDESVFRDLAQMCELQGRMLQNRNINSSARALQFLDFLGSIGRFRATFEALAKGESSQGSGNGQKKPSRRS